MNPQTKYQPKRRGKEHIHLLQNEDVRRWYENVSRGSIITADVCLRRLGRFCIDYNTTPKKLIKMNEKQLHNFLMDCIADLERKDFAGSYIVSIIRAIRSWLIYNGIVITRKIKIKDAHDTPTLTNERVPTKDELKKIFLSATKTARVCCVLMAHSGLRPQTIGDYLGVNGLTIGDFPELKIENDKVIFEKTPTLIRVRKEISKAKHTYFTFLSEEGCEYLKDYLEERIRNREQLTNSSPIITPKTAKKSFICTINIGDSIRNAIRKSGFQWRPYVLRCYFDTQLMLADSKGLVMRDYRSFWMGHKGDIENRYTTNKGRLPENIIEDMRNSYKKCQEFLETKEVGKKESELKQMFRLELLRVAGYSDEEIEKMKIDEMEDDKFKEIVREKLVGGKTNNHKQKVVQVNELERFLEDGWEYVNTLPNERVIIKFPS